MRVIVLFSLMAVALSTAAQFTGPGNALEMTGLPKYVNVTNAASQNVTTGITVEAWIYATSWGANPWSNSIVSKEDWASGSRGYALRCGGTGRLSFNIGIGTAWQEVVTTATVLNLNQWHHVAGTYNGTQLKIFVDGTEVGTVSVSASITSSPYDLRIGESSYSSVSSRPFSGRIDEVRFWNTGLTVNQLRDFMCRPVTSTHANYANLKGYWKFDEGTGTTTSDASGNSNTGTLVSGPVWLVSGIPLGETSAWSYASPFSLSLDNPLDSIWVSGFSPAPTGVQIYRITGPPVNTSLPTGYAQTGFSDGYWGVRIFGNPNASYTFNVKLKSWPASTGCMPMLISRADNATLTWTITNDFLNLQTLTVSVSATGRQEFMIYFGKNSVITYNGPTSACDGDSIILTANAQPSYSYLWHKNNLPIPAAASSSLVVKQSGDYSVVVTNAASCSDTSSIKTITINPKPNVQITPSGPTSFCQGDEVTLHVSGALSYLWSTAAIDDSIVVTQSGKYMVWGVDANNCIDSASQVVTVHPKPTPVITQSGKDLTTGHYDSYQWHFSNMPIPGANQQSYTPTQNGIYNVEVLDSNGCYAMSPTFTLTNVGIAEWTDPEQLVSVYPNPSVQGIFFIDYQGIVPATLTITGISGEIITTKILAPESILKFDDLSLAPGVYLLNLKNDNVSKCLKIIVTGTR
jgi:hypothetical protein